MNSALASLWWYIHLRARSYRPPPLRRGWVSACVLRSPERTARGWHRGALILNQVDQLLWLLPQLRHRFFLIERRGWHGANDSRFADIKLVEDHRHLPATRRSRRNAILLDIGPSDFVDEAVFRPLSQPCAYDVIQVSCWSSRKRIEMLIDAAARTPEIRFLHMGHFEHNGTAAEIRYRDQCIARAREQAPNLAFPFGDCVSNDALPKSKEQMNQWINQARIGVLTTTTEGINRFKMECISADRPMLVPDDVEGPTRKHIMPETGEFFAPNPEGLAQKLRAVLNDRQRFRPRAYLLRTSGKSIAIARLKQALQEMCRRTNAPFRFDHIDWDGRNDSLHWGEAALQLLDSHCGVSS